METLINPDHKYIDVADRVERLIENGVLKVGDKLLSVRSLSKEQGISLSTAFQSYYHLESKGLIEARPQSGYYVKFSREHILDLPKSCHGRPSMMYMKKDVNLKKQKKATLFLIPSAKRLLKGISFAKHIRNFISRIW